MRLQVGRAGRDLADHQIDCVVDWNLTGDQANIRGVIHADDAAEVQDAIDLRNQLVAYQGNGDEMVVPVIWSSDPTADGFYRVGSSNVDLGESGLERGVFPFRVGLQRIRGSASPQFESTITGAAITNGHGVTAESWFAFPGVVVEQLYRTDCRRLEDRIADGGVVI